MNDHIKNHIMESRCRVAVAIVGSKHNSYSVEIFLSEGFDYSNVKWLTGSEIKLIYLELVRNPSIYRTTVLYSYLMISDPCPILDMNFVKENKHLFVRLYKQMQIVDNGIIPGDKYLMKLKKYHSSEKKNLEIYCLAYEEFDKYEDLSIKDIDIYYL